MVCEISELCRIIAAQRKINEAADFSCRLSLSETTFLSDCAGRQYVHGASARLRSRNGSCELGVRTQHPPTLFVDVVLRGNTKAFLFLRLDQRVRFGQLRFDAF